MSALSLKCPLCCEKRFASFDSLKYHILGVARNMLCPACNVRFVNILELAEHIGRRCKEKYEFDIPPLVPIRAAAFKIDSRHVISSEKPKETNASSKGQAAVQVDEGNSEGDPGEVSDTNMDAEATYMCEVCNVQFTSIEDHLEKYHDGEDIILETEEGRAEEDPNPEEDAADADGDHFEMAESVDSPADLDMDMPDDYDEDDDEQQHQQEEEGEEEEEEERRPAPNVGQHLGVQEVPITEYYVMDHGRTLKISEEDASRIEDRASVIEIHQCPRCYLQFPKMDHYLKHICNPDKTNDNFKCAHCSAVFHSYQSLNAHMRMHIPKGADAKEKRIVTLGPHKCDVCDTMFPSFRSMKLHQRMHDPRAIASKCRGAETVDAVNAAATSGVVRQMFVCNICTMTYDKQYEEIHMRYHKIEETYNCPTCNRKFDTKESLEMHARVHNNVKQFSCSYCKKTFATNDALQDHVVDDCRDREFACRHCGRRFSRAHERVKHERIHTGERPYACQICGKAFRVSYCLTLHLRTHSGDRPHACPHCGKRFKAHSVFNHHMLTHSDVRAFRCSYCPKTFKTSVQLANHRNSHTKPFACKQCNRPFASLYAVKAHMETHKRDNNLKFDCYVCGAIYARDFALRDHLKSQHPEAAANAPEAGVVEIDSTETVESAARLELEMGVEDEEMQRQQAEEGS